MAEVMQQVLRCCGIKHLKKSTPYHLETNGLTEHLLSHPRAPPSQELPP